MVRGQMQRDRRLPIAVEVRPVQRDNRFLALCQRKKYPTLKQLPHIESAIAQQSINLLDRVLRIQRLRFCKSKPDRMHSHRSRRRVAQRKHAPRIRSDILLRVPMFQSGIDRSRQTRGSFRSHLLRDFQDFVDRGGVGGGLGADSPNGSRFVERILSVVTTLKQQRRNVLDYVVAACTASAANLPAPSLLPVNS